MRVLLVGTEDGGDHLHLVAETLGERRAEGPVGETAREDRLFAGATLPAEERAGDLAGRVHPLLDVDGEGEEVDSLPRLRRDHRAEHGGVAHLDEHGAVRLGRETTRLEGHGEARLVDRTTDTDR